MAACSCGCSTMTLVTKAEQACGCGCACCEAGPKSKDEEVLELMTLREAIEKRLADIQT